MPQVEERKLFFTENMPANKYRVDRIRKSPLDTPNKVIKDHQWILTQLGEMLIRFHSAKGSPLIRRGKLYNGEISWAPL